MQMSSLMEFGKRVCYVLEIMNIKFNETGKMSKAFLSLGAVPLSVLLFPKFSSVFFGILLFQRVLHITGMLEEWSGDLAEDLPEEEDLMPEYQKDYNVDPIQMEDNKRFGG